jgi:hypothetical protein
MAILTDAWPLELDPSRVPFRQRTVSTLRHMGLWGDMTQMDTVSVDDVSGFWVTGPVTVSDLITTGNAAIRWHHLQAAELAVVGEESWTRKVWRKDGRFRNLLPPVDATVHEIAASGHHSHQRLLAATLPELRQRLKHLAAEPRDEAVIRYVAVNTGQSRRRTVMLLRRLGVSEPAITGSEAARQLSVSPQRIHQLVAQISYRLDQVLAPGVTEPWLPQQPDLNQLVNGTARATAEH